MTETLESTEERRTASNRLISELRTHSTYAPWGGEPSEWSAEYRCPSCEGHGGEIDAGPRGGYRKCDDCKGKGWWNGSKEQAELRAVLYRIRYFVAIEAEEMTADEIRERIYDMAHSAIGCD